MINGIRRIGSTLGGIKQARYHNVTKTDHFFAYSSHFSIFVFSVPEFQHIATVCQGLDEIQMIHLCRKYPSYIAILHFSQSVEIFDFLARKTIFQYNFEEDYDFEWIDFNYRCDRLLLFTRRTGTIFCIDYTKKSPIEEYPFFYPDLTYFITSPDQNVVIATGSNYIVKLDSQTHNSFMVNTPIPCICLKFDPLNSMNCLMLGAKSTGWLVFTYSPSFNIISKSSDPKADTSSGDWLQSIPGYIITGSKSIGIFHIWNIANGEITDTFQLSECGIETLFILSQRELVATFVDGAIGVVDYVSKQFTKVLSASHSNTIFSCSFLPLKPILLASAAADGRICLWDVPSLERRGCSQEAYAKTKKRSEFYYCSFSPGGSYIAASDNNGCIFLYQTDKLSLLFQYKLHENICSHVEWSPIDSDIIATSGLDSKVIFFSVSKKEIVASFQCEKGKIRHISFCPHSDPISSFCCVNDAASFSQLSGQYIVGAPSSDSNLYFINSKDGKQVNVIHTDQKLYDMAWNPKIKNIVAVIDDSGGLSRIDILTGETKHMKVHNGHARAIAWCPALENIVLTGGYDGKVVLTDTQSFSRIAVINAGITHIYHISIHPDTPFLFATSSRDETIRLWSIDGLFPIYRLKNAFSHNISSIESISFGTGSHELSKLLQRIMAYSPRNNHSILGIVENQEQGNQTIDENQNQKNRLTFNDKEICHRNDVINIAHKRAKKLLGAIPKDQSAIIRNKKSKQTTIDAANLYLKIGNIKKFCELMFLAGEYDQAISFAPAVSSRFWINMINAKEKIVNGTQEAVELSLVSGNINDAISFLQKMDRCSDAQLVLAASRSTNFEPRTLSVQKKIEHQSNKSFIKSNPEEEDLSEEGKNPFIEMDFKDPSDFLPYVVASKRSLKMAYEGKPLLSAAALLSVGDINGAIWRLIHAGELIWAIAISSLLPNDEPKILEIVIRYTASQAIAKHFFKLLDPSQRSAYAPYLLLKNENERINVYNEIGIDSPNNYLLEARKSRGIVQANFLLAAGKFQEAAEISLIQLRKIMADKIFDFNSITDHLAILKKVDIVYVRNEIANEIVAICYYFGAYQAMWLGYSAIIERLVYSFERIVKGISDEPEKKNDPKKSEKKSPVVIDYLIPRVEELKMVASITLAKENLFNGIQYSQIHKLPCENYLKSIPASVKCSGGATVKSQESGVIPIDKGFLIPRSICSGKKINGNYFMLENGQSFMSLDEALMWFEVVPFSPLSTHARLLPY